MIDIGANLAGEAFAKDLAAVLARASEHGVKKIIVTGSSLADSEAALALSRAHPGVLYATAGIHPHAASQLESGSIAQLAQLLAHPAVVAIGETGLDFNRNYSSSDDQMQSFEAHLQLARQVDKPLFLHERDAFEPFFELMREHSSLGERAVLHCFTGNRKALKSYLDLGMY
ncbi:MAG: TatD family hydrolase, partial [Gammaproteobacteria bacterium]|nr:TatD family hydrolase [Gammaproteobacteria bacterium]